jgi:aldose 1-epimerase
MKLQSSFASLFVTLFAMSIHPQSTKATDYVELKRERYQKEIDGKKVDLYAIKNKSGMVVKIANWGAKVQQILVPDKKGVLGDVALGYESIDQLQAGQASMDAFVGRFANRIGQAKFTLNGQEYKLAANNGPNSLHGGAKGSRFVVFDAKQIDDATVQMTYVFKDGEENYPGTVPLRVIYSVTDKNEFVVEYHATAVDKATVVNFTTHTFFNLAGQGKGDVLGHIVTVNADNFTLSFPKILSGADSRNEAESAHHPVRCLPPSICLGRLSPTCSSRNAGLKSRISFSAISSILL